MIIYTCPKCHRTECWEDNARLCGMPCPSCRSRAEQKVSHRKCNVFDCDNPALHNSICCKGHHTHHSEIEPPPPPPPMRIGERGDTIDRAGVRRNSEGVVIGAPPTVEYRKRPGIAYGASMFLLVVACMSAGFLWGWMVRGSAL